MGNIYLKNSQTLTQPQIHIRTHTHTHTLMCKCIYHRTLIITIKKRINHLANRPSLPFTHVSKGVKYSCRRQAIRVMAFGGEFMKENTIKITLLLTILPPSLLPSPLYPTTGQYCITYRSVVERHAVLDYMLWWKTRRDSKHLFFCRCVIRFCYHVVCFLCLSSFLFLVCLLLCSIFFSRLHLS